MKIAHRLTSAKRPINLLNAAANLLTIHSQEGAQQEENLWYRNRLDDIGCNEHMKAFLAIFRNWQPFLTPVN